MQFDKVVETMRLLGMNLIKRKAGRYSIGKNVSCLSSSMNSALATLLFADVLQHFKQNVRTKITVSLYKVGGTC